MMYNESRNVLTRRNSILNLCFKSKMYIVFIQNMIMLTRVRKVMHLIIFIYEHAQSCFAQ